MPSITAEVNPKSLRNTKNLSMVICDFSYYSLSKVICLPVLKIWVQ